MRGEREANCVVIEGGGTPAVDGVTGFALRSEFACMNIVVAGGTIHGRACKNSILMAVFTSHVCMLSFQFEGKLRMVYGSVPAFGGVAGGAFETQTAVVFIVFCMAGITV